jgi:hypothetical protein
MLSCPSCHAYDTLTPELVCVVRLDGTQNAPATPRSFTQEPESFKP